MTSIFREAQPPKYRFTRQLITSAAQSFTRLIFSLPPMKFFRPLALALSAGSTASFTVTTGSRRAFVAATGSIFAPFVTTSTSSVPRQQQKQQQRLSSSSLSMSAAADFAKAEIEKNTAVIFSKSYCPYCSATKALFNELKIDGTVIYELDNMDNGADIQAALLEMTGQRTVPSVFIKGQHVGGNDDVQTANKSGKLKELLGA